MLPSNANNNEITCREIEIINTLEYCLISFLKSTDLLKIIDNASPTAYNTKKYNANTKNSLNTTLKNGNECTYDIDP